MHRFLLVVLALAISLIAAAAEVTEQFVLGDWSNDPEAPANKLTGASPLPLSPPHLVHELTPVAPAAHEVKYDVDDGSFWGCADADEPAEEGASRSASSRSSKPRNLTLPPGPSPSLSRSSRRRSSRSRCRRRLLRPARRFRQGLRGP